jgi:beta-glucosidase
MKTPSAKNWIGTPAENPTSVTLRRRCICWIPLFQYVWVKPSYEFGYGLSYTSLIFQK